MVAAFHMCNRSIVGVYFKIVASKPIVGFGFDKIRLVGSEHSHSLYIIQSVSLSLTGLPQDRCQLRFMSPRTEFSIVALSVIFLLNELVDLKSDKKPRSEIKYSTNLNLKLYPIPKHSLRKWISH